MRAVDIIAKKRDGLALTAQEIEFFIQGYTAGDIPDYQASAWAMAVLLRGMAPEETANLTMAMVRSGETLDLSRLGITAVDKHSTGGVGDKTTLVVAPLVAACGLPVAKMSGRGLGFSGGTLDKLESIPGMKVNLSNDAFLAAYDRCGVVVASQTAEFVPADGKLYALRDVTATVPSLPLIASSIMSKKLASGCDVVLDVKTGHGAFMESLDDARALAELMITIGESAGRRITAVLSDMSQPLGHAVGNAVEVREAIETLQGHGPVDFREHCIVIAAEMLLLGHVAETPDAARVLAERSLEDGTALDRFRCWIAVQEGDASVIEDLNLLPQAPVVEDVLCSRSGWMAGIDAREVGLAAVQLGGGREKKGDTIDASVGIVLHQKVGDALAQGDPLFTVHAASGDAAAAATRRVLDAFSWSSTSVTPPPLFYGVLRGS